MTHSSMQHTVLARLSTRTALAASRPLAALPVRATLPAVAALSALVCACSGDVVNVGEGEMSQLKANVCAAPPTGQVVVWNQADLDALEGCETIDGDLLVAPFAGADLRPLHALHTVTGWLSFDTPEGVVDGAAIQQFNALAEAGWLTLDGLESLQSVGALRISGLAAPTLEPLSNLRVVTDGDLILLHCGSLRDLHGLENLRGVDDLTLSCAELESLGGLRLRGSISSLYIEGERLAELGSLEVTEVASDLTLLRTALPNLDAFASLEAVGTLVLWGNAALTNADGLARLQSVDGLVIRENLVLPQLPTFSALARLERLVIDGNAALSALPAFPALNQGIDPASPDERDERTLLSLRPRLIDLRNNPALQQLDLPLGWQSAGFVRIENNAALERLDLGALSAIDQLEIQANPALSTVDLGALTTVDSLRVRDNPQLPSGAFDAVQTFARDMSGNAGAP